MIAKKNAIKFKQRSILDFFGPSNKIGGNKVQPTLEITLSDDGLEEEEDFESYSTTRIFIDVIRINRVEIGTPSNFFNDKDNDETKTDFIDDEQNYIDELKEKNFFDVDKYLEVDFKAQDEDSIDSQKENIFLKDSEKDYKLKHFRSMIDAVLCDDHYVHLFDEEDWKILYDFTHLSYGSQALYLRLLIRKYNWIRLNKINYTDIEDLPLRLEQLIKNNFLHSIRDLDNIDESLKLLEISELKSLLKCLKGVNVKSSASKSLIIKAIHKHVNQSKSIASHFHLKSDSSISKFILNRIKRLIGCTCYKINKQTSRVFLRIALIFFPSNVNDEEEGLSLAQELFDLYRMDKGELRFCPYELNKRTKVFPRRENLLFFEEACNLEGEIMTAIESRQYQHIHDSILPSVLLKFTNHLKSNLVKFDETLPMFLRRFTGGHLLVRCLSHCTTIMEMLKLYEEAVDLLLKLLRQNIYCQDYRGKWSERLIINYEKHLKKPSEAHLMIQRALLDPAIKGGHRYSIYLRAEKAGLVSSLKVQRIPEFKFKCPQITIFAPILKEGIEGRKNIFVSANKEGGMDLLSVEEVALEHYRNLGYISGIHCEGAVFNTLFCLLFWDIIYLSDESTSDAFHSFYQRVPLDLNCETFYLRRYPIIKSRLDFIHSSSQEELIKFIEGIWITFEGCLSLIDWERCSLQLLKQIIECIQINILVGICDRLAQSYRFHRSGFPDLLVWNINNKTIKAVEVKGPGDQISPKQALWIDYMNTFGLEAEICYVKPKRNT